jgi:hypothetical protein
LAATHFRGLSHSGHPTGPQFYAQDSTGHSTPRTDMARSEPAIHHHRVKTTPSILAVYPWITLAFQGYTDDLRGVPCQALALGRVASAAPAPSAPLPRLSLSRHPARFTKLKPSTTYKQTGAPTAEYVDWRISRAIVRTRSACSDQCLRQPSALSQHSGRGVVYRHPSLRNPHCTWMTHPGRSV